MNTALAARWRALTLASDVLLIIIVCAWQLSAQLTGGAFLRALAFSIPALLPLRGLARSDRYTMRWSTLCVLPYFVVSLTEAFANPTARWWAIAVLGNSLLWFFALVSFLRVTAPESAPEQPTH